MDTIRFITLHPGHFHASLVQKEMVDEVSPLVHVVGPLGPDLIAHLGRIAGFNTRGCFADNVGVRSTRGPAPSSGE